MQKLFADKTKKVAKKTKKTTEKAADKTVDTSKAVADKTGDVASSTARGTKKTGNWKSSGYIAMFCNAMIDPPPTNAPRLSKEKSTRKQQV